MSMAEIKEQIAGMSAEERLEVAALIAHLNRADDPEYQAELDQRMSAMDAGRKNSAAALENSHRNLSNQGR
jgi:alanine racemase